MTFPVVTGAVYYGFDARPHGIVLGFAGLALVCWQMVNEGERRGRWLLFFSLALLGAFLSHCYAILLLIAFGAPELFEFATTRRLRLAHWAAMLIPAAI